MDPAPFFVAVVGGEHDEDELGELRRLEAEPAQFQPPARAADFLPEDEHERQDDGAGDQRRLDPAPELSVVVEYEGHPGRGADPRPGQLPRRNTWSCRIFPWRKRRWRNRPSP